MRVGIRTTPRRVLSYHHFISFAALSTVCGAHFSKLWFPYIPAFPLFRTLAAPPLSHTRRPTTHCAVKFLHLIRPFMVFIPEIQNPERKVNPLCPPARPPAAKLLIQLY